MSNPQQVIDGTRRMSVARSAWHRSAEVRYGRAALQLTLRPTREQIRDSRVSRAAAALASLWCATNFVRVTLQARRAHFMTSRCSLNEGQRLRSFARRLQVRARL